MSDVSRLSMDPSIAMVSAGVIAPARMFGERSGSCGVGRPVGTKPMMGTSVSHSTPIMVPTPSATSVGGRMRRSRAGHRMPTASVTAAMAKAPVLKLAMPSPQPLMAAMGPPSATGIPMNGSVCSRMMMMPMPDMNPEITEYGVKSDETADAHEAQQHLEEPGHDDDGERGGEVVRVEGDDDGHRDGHGASGAGDLGAGPAEHRGEEADGYGAVDARERPQPGSLAERQRHG